MPPPAENCESIPQRIDLAEGHILSFTRYYQLGTSVLVYFGINQSTLIDPVEDVWADVARIDSEHSEIHRHQFHRNRPQSREVIERYTQRNALEVINRQYELCQRIMREEWQENLRRWEQ